MLFEFSNELKLFMIVFKIHFEMILNQFKQIKNYFKLIKSFKISTE